MRLLFLLSALALLLPPVTLAHPSGAGEGTLSVRDGEGRVTLDIRGTVVGHLGSGVLEVEDPRGNNCDALNVWGAERERWSYRAKDLEAVVFVCRFSGSNIRFRLVGGLQAVRITRGKDIDLSVVGLGVFSLKSVGRPKGGTYSLNGDPYSPLPDETVVSDLYAPKRPIGNG